MDISAELMVKRGISFGNKESPPTPAELQLLADAGVNWFHNWYYAPPVVTGWTPGHNGMEFVPTMFRLKSDTAKVEELVKASPPGSIRHLLVLNEPNHKKQGWATPQEAAKHWPKWEELAEKFNLRLVGPQLAYGRDMKDYSTPVAWMDAFLEEFRAKNDGRDPRIDALGYHFYGRNGLGKHLKHLEKYGKPIWLTEFANWKAKNIEEQKTWMRKYVALCEKNPNVERYSWFIGRSAKGPLIALLGANGALTELGEFYINLPRAPAPTAATAEGKVDGSASSDEDDSVDPGPGWERSELREVCEPQQRKIALICCRGKPLTAEPDSHLHFHRETVGDWEKWIVYDHADGSVSLQSHHGLFLSSEPNGVYIANRESAGDCEKFTIEERGDGKVAVRSVHGFFISAQPDGTVQHRTKPRGWESFELREVCEPQQRKIALICCRGKPLTAEPDSHLHFHRETVGDWEKWIVYDHADGSVSLQSHHGLFLSSEPSGVYIANRESAGDCEKFTIEERGDGKVAVRSVHGFFISAQPDGTVQHRTKPRCWESFELREV